MFVLILKYFFKGYENIIIIIIQIKYNWEGGKI